jgi:ketosteroid isomerase-like protein
MPASTRELYTHFAEALAALDADRYADLFAPDGALELPFRRPGIPARWRGREEIRAAARQGWAAAPLRLHEVRTAAVHDTTDPDVLVAEHDLVGVSTTTGRPFTLPSLVVLEARDGRIAVLREYLDVVAVARATERLPELVAGLDGAGDATAEPAPRPSPPDGEIRPSGPAEVFARYRQAVLANSPDAIADLFAPDGAFEYPFTVPGMPERVEGRERVRANLHRMLGAFRFEEYRDVRLHQAADPEVVVIEHDIAGTIVSSGRAHALSYVYVLRTRDGEIVHLRDYVDLLDVAEIAGGLPALLARFARF